MFKRYWMAILMALAGAPALAAPTVSLTAPVDQTSYVAPATITLAADAASGDGTIVQVAFYEGQALIGSTTSAPYTLDWPQVGAGTYQLTAVATDSANISTTSAPVTITVTAAAGPAPQVYYIHSDHLNTPRLITDENNHAVWQWDSDPFGATVADDDPGNTGTAFVFNARFAGQYFDRETGLHYNYFRDYDPATGRYLQSDPIGLDGGINTYAYVEGNPISYIDLYGLASRAICGDQNSSPFPKGGPPRDPRTANYTPLPNAVGPHTTLGTRNGSSGSYTQGATFDSSGKFVGRTDVTNHGRHDHTRPHYHPATGPNSVGKHQSIPSGGGGANILHRLNPQALLPNS